jgi:hypothetical protein
MPITPAMGRGMLSSSMLNICAKSLLIAKMVSLVTITDFKSVPSIEIPREFSSFHKLALSVYPTSKTDALP